jgi:hypothetical protein
MKVGIIYGLFFLSFIGIFTSNLPKSSAKNRSCIAIAKVISSTNSNYKLGTTICYGTILKVSQKYSLEIACINAVHSIRVVSSNDLLECPISKFLNKSKNPDSFSSVVRGFGDNPVVIRPFGLNQIKPNPEVQWLPIKKADSYRIVVDDWDKYWFSVNSSIARITLPKLNPGTYQVLISALNHGDIIGETTITIVILTPDKVNQFSKLMSDVDLLHDSPDQTIIYKLGILTRFNLLEESITYLSKYLALSKDNMFLTRTLGDLYLDASEPYQAYKEYLRYEKIAKKYSSPKDLKLAKERIQLLAPFKNY